MYGIENLKKVVKFACDFTRQVATATADGWQWNDFFSFIDEAAQLPGVAKSWPDIKNEIGELSEEEREDLFYYVANEFDIPNDKVEMAIENSLAWVNSTINLVNQWKNV